MLVGVGNCILSGFKFATVPLEVLYIFFSFSLSLTCLLMIEYSLKFFGVSGPKEKKKRIKEEKRIFSEIQIYLASQI